MLGKLTDLQLEDVLNRMDHAHIACCTDGEPYSVPIFYAYKDNYIYGHTFYGKKIEIMRKNPRVCLNIHDFLDIWTWRSVNIYGTYEELKGKDATDAVDILADRLRGVTQRSYYSIDFLKEGKSHYTRKDHKEIILYRISIDEITGRYEWS